MLPSTHFPPSLPCFALLDDAQDVQARSRLYTQLFAILECRDRSEWADMLHVTSQALTEGAYAVALLSYETGLQLQEIAAHADGQIPSRILLFRSCQHLTGAQVQAYLQAQADSEPAGIAEIRANVDEQEFCDAIHKVQDYIVAGDTYQVNYTYRLYFSAYGTPVNLYRRLRQRQPVPYGALIVLPDGETIISMSPELFVQHQRGQLLAQPMKGTAAASGDAEEDQRRALALAADPKNRAENLMIVDLLRNDLGRIAQTGSVTVPRLFDVRRYSSVLQMTSTVQAELRPDLDLNQVLTALYPCGSITGAPKHRTMQIIREVESAGRGIYTGAIGWFDPVADMRQLPDFCLNVPIRTLHLRAPDQRGLRHGSMGVGAGIVYDSQAGDEYAECQLKASFLTGLLPEFSLFETMLVNAELAMPLLDRHLQRLLGSARYFNFPCDEQDWRAQIETQRNQLTAGQAYRLRMSLAGDGSLGFQHAPLPPMPQSVKVMLSPHIVQSAALLTRHKSTVRAMYDHAWRSAEQSGAFDQLFFNERGHLCEGGRSSVFVKLDGQWWTPPLSDGVLPGVMRSVLLEDPQWRAREKSLTRADLLQAQQIVLCNALRGAFNAELLHV